MRRPMTTLSGQKDILIHPETSDLLEQMLLVLKEQGEEAAFANVRRLLREVREK